MSAFDSPPAPSSLVTTSKQTHYDVLQISHSATPDEIKAAYRSLVIGYHPDKQQSSSIVKNNENCIDTQILSKGLSAIDFDDDAEGNGEISACNNDNTETEKSALIACEIGDMPTQNSTIFHQLQAAYHCLRDPDKRRQYDESISRQEERDEWKRKGAVEVNLSEMECDVCCVVDEDNSDDEEEGQADAKDEGSPLQKVYFYPCRCGDTFQIMQEEVLQSIGNSRVWQCDSCSLTIRINIDIDFG